MTFKNTLGLSILILFFTICATLLAQAQEPSEGSPRLAVHLLDYLAKDYSGAVSAAGKVISKSEYAEQTEFAAQALKASSNVSSLANDVELTQSLRLLEGLIAKRSPPDKVSALARSLQQRVIQLTGLEIYPSHWPDLKTGRALFASNCVACHGEQGRGDGVASKGLKPPPANLTDSHMAEISPFAAYNTIRLGVSGTAMAAFQSLSDDEVWALSFYVTSLRYPADAEKKVSGIKPADLNLKNVASLSDEALAQTLEGSDSERTNAVAAIRLYTPKEDQNSYLALAKRLLTEARSNYSAGQQGMAKTKALRAYLEGIEPIEPRAKATDPVAVAELEERMSFVRGAIEGKKSNQEVEKSVDAAMKQIDEVTTLIAHQDMSPVVSFFAAFAILLREGFEAVLIILALLGVIRAAGNVKAALWVHAGWIAALGCGFVAWFFSGWLMGMSGASREMMEGLTSIFAVGVLLYIGFWLHRQSEIGRWKEFLEVKIRGILQGKNLIGLAAISFLAVFREAFETVLFLRAIWFEGGESTHLYLSLGVFTALGLVIGASWAALTLSKRMPIRQLFTVSSVLMLILATILTGKGLHSVQETGWLTVTSMPFRFRWELAGIYPTLETAVAQMVVCALVIFIWNYGRKPSPVRAQNREQA